MTNFKINTLVKFNLINNLKIKYTNKIICRNFFLFLFLLNFFKKNKNCFFIKPFKKKTLTILRAPYRYKLSKHQLIINRYLIFLKNVIFFENKIFFKTYNQIIILLLFFYKNVLWFETNLVFFLKLKISFNFYSFFFLK